MAQQRQRNLSKRDGKCAGTPPQPIGVHRSKATKTRLLAPSASPRAMSSWRPERESNARLILRRDLFYPLNYRGPGFKVHKPRILREQGLFKPHGAVLSFLDSY